MKKEKAKTNYTQGVAWKSYYNKQKNDEDVEEDKEDDPLFSVLIDPDQLDKTDIIWSIALESEVPEVYTAAIKFLIFTHMSLDEGLHEDRSQITQALIKRCFELIGDNPTPFRVRRIVDVLRTIIEISEKKGTGDV